ncbi:hypothetical protein [Desulfosporosinus meridiei]|uniref:Spore coat protein U domain-containing protein n=1 Tax=Desulfosporosinus meridiei (strain ATCC BAA-275 / DSM 13257 / KCTC 12902 / NCIMB 13706 / S10) TaxID=768704 RepID=J7IWL2_DESMD|nr:hypothetical protein [Desulfosporosinus meridiei]AFQ43503.1 hypothetical protein Desmer_1510 [Desulfosporosinus meridiei DSM 13257]
MKKLIPVLLTIFMALGCQVALGAVVSTESASGIVKPAAYETISGGQCKIVNNGNGTINISGSTSTYNPVKQIGLKLNLQYLSSGTWRTVDSYSYSKSNSSFISGGEQLSVSSGYYRVYAQHTSLTGTMSESGQSYSEALYIQ